MAVGLCPLTAVCVNPMQPVAEEIWAQDPATPELRPAGVMVELCECSRAREEVQLWENGHYVVCSLYCVTPDAHTVRVKGLPWAVAGNYLCLGVTGQSWGRFRFPETWMCSLKVHTRPMPCSLPE